jgi:hypothetical protein
VKLAALAAASAVLATVSAHAASARIACPASQLDDPYRVAAQFLTTAVQRRNVAASYRLATPSLRGSLSCEDWASGRLPVRAFRDIDWSRAAYEPVAGGDGQIVLRVFLYRPHVAKPTPFLMELQTESTEPGWHVGYFQPDRWYTPEPKPAKTSLVS